MKQIDIIYAKGNFWEDFTRFLKQRKSRRNQRTFCWCPICKEDLCSNNSLVFDYKTVRYECTNCRAITDWHFDVPVPILLKTQYPNPILENLDNMPNKFVVVYKNGTYKFVEASWEFEKDPDWLVTIPLDNI